MNPCPVAKMFFKGQWKVTYTRRFPDGRVFVEFDPMVLPGESANGLDRYSVGYTYSVYHDDHLFAADLVKGQLITFEETESRDPQLTDSDPMRYIRWSG